MEILKAHEWKDLGLKIELFRSRAGVPTIRMSDTDADRVFGLIQFSRLEMAEARYAEEIAKGNANLYPEEGPKMEGANGVNAKERAAKGIYLSAEEWWESLSESAAPLWFAYFGKGNEHIKSAAIDGWNARDRQNTI